MTESRTSQIHRALRPSTIHLVEKITLPVKIFRQSPDLLAPAQQFAERRWHPTRPILPPPLSISVSFCGSTHAKYSRCAACTTTSASSLLALTSVIKYAVVRPDDKIRLVIISRAIFDLKLGPPRDLPRPIHSSPLILSVSLGSFELKQPTYLIHGGVAPGFSSRYC